MAVMVEGAKVVKLAIDVDEKGEVKITGTYHLMSSTGKVLAKQEFGGYNGMVVSVLADTTEAAQQLLTRLQRDLGTTLGL